MFFFLSFLAGKVNSPNYYMLIKKKCPSISQSVYCMKLLLQGERESFERYYRNQRKQQAKLALQPSTNMVISFKKLMNIKFLFY